MRLRNLCEWTFFSHRAAPCWVRTRTWGRCSAAGGRRPTSVRRTSAASVRPSFPTAPSRASVWGPLGVSGPRPAPARRRRCRAGPTPDSAHPRCCWLARQRPRWTDRRALAPARRHPTPLPAKALRAEIQDEPRKMIFLNAIDLFNFS